MKAKSEIREAVWKKLRKVALPDPIFDFDFSSFIPDFQGSEKCVETIVDLEAWKRSGLVFITPDNSLMKLREKAIHAGKRFVMTTYGIRRGFLLIEGIRFQGIRRHSLQASVKLRLSGRRLVSRNYVPWAP